MSNEMGIFIVLLIGWLRLKYVAENLNRNKIFRGDHSTSTLILNCSIVTTK